MKKPTEILTLFDKYRKELDWAIDTFLKAQGSLPMYGMMRYFMGFTDSSFNASTVFGGKRFRSGLSLFIADSFGAKERMIDAAVSIELFHNFTLIHDDIMDGDALRRGRETVWKIWGVDHAINTGDAQSLIACQKLIEGVRRYPDTGAAIAEWLIPRYTEICEGQYLDFFLGQSPIGSHAVNEKAYLVMTDKKTSVLVGAATKAGALAAGRPAEECENFWRYGRSLGLAYQLHDDFVSIWGDAKKLGKLPHGDLRERKKTLHVLKAFQELSKRDKACFAKLYNAPPPLKPPAIQGLLHLMDSTCSKEYARAAIEKAKTSAREAA